MKINFDHNILYQMEECMIALILVANQKAEVSFLTNERAHIADIMQWPGDSEILYQWPHQQVNAWWISEQKYEILCILSVIDE